MNSSDLINMPVKREVFYVGGEYVKISVKAPPIGDDADKFMVNQIYVEKLTPSNPTQKHPLVFIAGGCQSGTNFLETPDGRPGWAHFFLSHGYTVYLTDQPSRGRSAWHPSIGSLSSLGAGTIQTLFTATAEHDMWPQSKLHTQWPGTGKAGDPVFDAFFASQVPLQSDKRIAEEQNTKGYSALLDRIGEAYVVSHSQAGPYGWRIGDARPQLVKGIVAIEPGGPPFEKKVPYRGQKVQWGITDCEIIYEPSAGPNAEYLDTVRLPAKDENHCEIILQREPAKQLKNLSKVPVLVVTAEASYHAQYDYCTVEYLRQAGVSVEHVDLPEEGIKGNGHMMFMEKNNIEIAERVLKWLKEH